MYQNTPLKTAVWNPHKRPLYKCGFDVPQYSTILHTMQAGLLLTSISCISLDNQLLECSMLQVRYATLNDLDVLTSFSSALCEETEGRHPNVSVVRAGVSKILESHDWFILVAEDVNGKIIGEVTMGGQEWSDWSNGLFWWVTSSYVDKKSRGLGVSRLLYEKLREIAKESPEEVIGIKGALKETNYSAQAALSLIGRNHNGYIVIEERFRAVDVVPVRVSAFA